MTGKQALALRLATVTDGPFLFTLFTSNCTDELGTEPAAAPIPQTVWQARFEAQQKEYVTCPNSQHWIIERQAPFPLPPAAQQPQHLVQPIGRICFSTSPTEIRLLDMALLPDFRGQGIGTGLLQWLQAQGRLAQKPVRLQVCPGSRALQLYERLGFGLLTEKNSAWVMEWAAAS